ncbi:hypothetical protein GF413_04580, partial [Candidatus Micrarchaeota archaeon]|nr:hypothetical protein [Candidatus Micrarchaeota archaeon]
MAKEVKTRKPDTTKRLQEEAIAQVPVPQPTETGSLAQKAGQEAERQVRNAEEVGENAGELGEASVEEAVQATEEAVALDSESMGGLTKERLYSSVEALELEIGQIKSIDGYSRLPEELRDRIENVAWLASQARNRLDSMEGPGQEEVLLRASDEVSLATFAMGTLPLAKQAPESGVKKFHEKLKELREMEIETRVGREEKLYAELREAAVAASLESRLGSNSGNISFARAFLQKNKKSYSAEETAKIRKTLALAAKLHVDAEKSLREGKLLEADALLSKSNGLCSATMMYMGAAGAIGSMRPPIKQRKTYRKLKTGANAELAKLDAAIGAISALEPSMEPEELSAKMLEELRKAQQASDAVQKKAAEAELLRFDASREGYVDKRLERASKSARSLIDAGEYEDANDLLGIALLYKGTYEKSSYEGVVGKDEKKKTLLQKQKELAKQFGYSLKSDNIRQGRIKLGRVLDELCPPEGKARKKPMSEQEYRRELSAAGAILKGVRRGLTHAREARKDQEDQLLSLGKGQEKKPETPATDTDIDLMAAYGIIGREKDAEEVLVWDFPDHLDAERGLYLSSLDIGEK